MSQKKLCQRKAKLSLPRLKVNRSNEGQSQSRDRVRSSCRGEAWRNNSQEEVNSGGWIDEEPDGGGINDSTW